MSDAFDSQLFHTDISFLISGTIGVPSQGETGDVSRSDVIPDTLNDDTHGVDEVTERYRRIHGETRPRLEDATSETAGPQHTLQQRIRLSSAKCPRLAARFPEFSSWLRAFLDY